MNKFKRFAAAVLSLCMCFGAVGALAACDDEPETEQPQTPATLKGDFVITVKDDKGAAVADVEFAVYSSATDAKVADLKTNAEGKATVRLDYAMYYVKLNSASLPAQHFPDAYLWEDVKIDGTDDALEIVLEDTTPDGSELKPFTLVVNDDGNSTVTLAANAEYYYIVRYQEGAKLVIESESVQVKLSAQSEWQEAVNGVLTVVLEVEGTNIDAGRTFIHFQIKNTTSAELSVTVTLDVPATEE